MLSIPEKKNPIRSFCDEIESCSETIFLALLILRLCGFYEGKINWTANETGMLVFSLILMFGTMLGPAAFLI